MRRAHPQATSGGDYPFQELLSVSEWFWSMHCSLLFELLFSTLCGVLYLVNSLADAVFSARYSLLSKRSFLIDIVFFRSCVHCLTWCSLLDWLFSLFNVMLSLAVWFSVPCVSCSTWRSSSDGVLSARLAVVTHHEQQQALPISPDNVADRRNLTRLRA